MQCNTWTDIDRVCVLINGRAGAGLDFRKSEHPEMFAKSSVRFEREIPVELKSDAHLIVVAIGEGSTLANGYGHSWHAKMLPVAYNNPIYLDVNSNGFEPNYDTLGHPYLDFGFAPGTTKPAE